MYIHIHLPMYIHIYVHIYVYIYVYTYPQPALDSDCNISATVISSIRCSSRKKTHTGTKIMSVVPRLAPRLWYGLPLYLWWVFSSIWCVLLWEYVIRMNVSSHTHGWVMCHTYMNESCLTDESCVTLIWMSQFSHIWWRLWSVLSSVRCVLLWDPCHAYDESSHAYESWHTRMNESCHTYINESRHTHLDTSLMCLLFREDARLLFIRVLLW